MEHVKPIRQKWFGVACCPPNIARTLASLGDYLIFQKKENLYVNLYLTAQVHVKTDGGEVLLQMETDFPNSGEVGIQVCADAGCSGNLYLRIPNYVDKYTLSVDGQELSCEVEKGYAKLPIGQGSHYVKLAMELQPRIVRSNPRIRENIGRVAVMKGPLVYCMEEQDNGENLPAYYLNPLSLREEYDPVLLGGTTVIRGSGVKDEIDDWKADEPYGGQKTGQRTAELMFIPYAYWCNRKPGEMLVWVKELQK